MTGRFTHFLQFWLLKIAYFGLRLLPRRLRGACGALLGDLAWRFGIRRQVVRDNLKTAFPDLPVRGIHQVSRNCFRHFGCVATSLAAVDRIQATDLGVWLHFEGLEVLDRALVGGRGGLVVSGHLGNWEVAGAASARLGYPVSFVVTTQRNKRVEAWLDTLRRRCGVEIIKRKDAIKGVLRALDRNRLVAILIDQDAHDEGVFVPFFGRPSSTPRGPAVFHKRTGAPLIFMSSSRLPGESYRVRLDEVPDMRTASDDEIMTELNRRLEAAVRRTPEQWFWMHKRWKTRAKS